MVNPRNAIGQHAALTTFTSIPPGLGDWSQQWFCRRTAESHEEECRRGVIINGQIKQQFFHKTHLKKKDSNAFTSLEVFFDRMIQYDTKIVRSRVHDQDDDDDDDDDDTET